jgi:gas vesicle protein
MSNETPTPSMIPVLLSFLAGAAAGAVLVALTTPKSGPELRGDLKDAACRAKRRAKDLAEEASGAWEDMKGRTVLAAADLKRGFADSVNDLKHSSQPAAPDAPRSL